jgi:Ras-related protein Rab-7A
MDFSLLLGQASKTTRASAKSMSIPPMEYRKIKVLILGESSVGKTSILSQFVMREFSPSYRPTIGADYVSRQMEVNGSFFTLQIWDTAGQERFRSLGSSFYRGTEICVFVYDLTHEASFHSVEGWYQLFRHECDPLPANFPFLLLGNKLDDGKQRVVPKEEGEALATQYGFLFYEVSAKSSDNIADAFEAILRRYLESLEPVKEETAQRPLGIERTPTEGPKQCC